MSFYQRINPVIKPSIFTKIIGFSGVLFIGTVKGLQYSWDKYPDITHKFFWSKIIHKFYEGSSRDWTLNNLDIIHYFATKILKYRLFPKVNIDTQNMDLSVKYGEYTFKNPLGNASGIDKIGWMIDGLSSLGFGFVELGSIAPEPEYWAEKPKYVDWYQKLVEGRKSLMWKNVYWDTGAQTVLLELCGRQNKFLNKKSGIRMDTLLGISLMPAKSTIESVPYLIKVDYQQSVDVLLEFSDYIVINITEKDKSKRSAMALLREETELRKLIQLVRAKIIMTLGKTAAFEYSHF